MTREEAKRLVDEVRNRATIMFISRRDGNEAEAVIDERAALLNVLEALGLIKFDEPKPKLSAWEAIAGTPVKVALPRVDREIDGVTYNTTVLGGMVACDVQEALDRAGYKIVKDEQP